MKQKDDIATPPTESPLPELSVWFARSTYAAGVTLSFTLLNLLGFDPAAWLTARGLDETQLIDAIMIGIPLAAGIWAWWERKAPNYQLVLGKAKPVPPPGPPTE